VVVARGRCTLFNRPCSNGVASARASRRSVFSIAALHEAMYAETRAHAREAITRFAAEYGAKYPKAVTTLERDADALLIFFDSPPSTGSICARPM
jgi:transposase-like protein